VRAAVTEGCKQLGGRQPHLVTDAIIAGDRDTCLDGVDRAESGQLLRCGEAHLIADAVVTGDGAESLSGAAGIESGQMLCRGQAVLIALVVHGILPF